MQRINPRWLALLAITLIAIYLCWLIISPFVNVILWAVVLSIIAFPYHLKLLKRGLNPTLAALISTLGVVLVVLLPILIIAIAVVAQVPDSDQIRDWVVQAKGMIAENSRVYQAIDPYVDLDWLKDPQIVKERAQKLVQPLAQQSVALATAAVSGLAALVIEIFFALFTLFYFLRDSRAIGKSVTNMLPLEAAQSEEVFARCQNIIQASVQGVILIAAIQGALGGIAFWVLGVPSAILLAVLMFILSMVPAVGSVLVWLPAVAYLGFTGHWGKAITLAVWCGGVVGMVDNLLRPRLVGQKTGMHDLVVFFSVLGGLQVFGILGLFVGPVVVAIALSIVEVFKQASHAWRDQPKAVLIDDTPSTHATESARHPMGIDTPHD